MRAHLAMDGEAEAVCARVGWSGLFLLLAAAAAFVRASEIDYSQPGKYLAQGCQTTIDPRHIPAVASIGVHTNTAEEIGKIIDWKARFRSVSAGGRYVGVRTVNDILATRELTGCHDHGILLAALLRHFGFPAIMVDATGIAWSRRPDNERRGFSGHVFVEIYAGGRWMLLDSTSGRTLSAYDPGNPFIAIAKDVEPLGYYVMFKGRDPADYGIRSVRDLNEAQIRFARRLRVDPAASR